MKIMNVLSFALRYGASLVFVVGASVTYSQEVISVSVDWKEPQLWTQGETEMFVPVIEGQELNGFTPHFFWRHKLNKAQHVTPSLQVVQTSPAYQKDVDFLTLKGIEVGTLDYKLSVSHAVDEKHVVLNMFPFIREGNQILRVEKVEITLDKAPPASLAWVEKDFVGNSVLKSGSGLWFKISVPQDGIYKIDRDFIEANLGAYGVDVNSLDPHHVHIYGNGEGRLPEKNWIPRTDDLAKNAVKIVGGGDGSFGVNDYLLFYGWGPHRLYANGTVALYQDRNPYSDVSCYFINIDSQQAPLTIQSAIPPTDPVTHNVNTYSYLGKYERDLKSLVKGGQRWYGELFNTDLIQTFTFNVPNIDASVPASFKVFVAANASSGPGNTHSYSIGGTQLASESLPISSGSDFRRGDASFTYNTPATSMPLTISVSRTSADIVMYLDYIEMNARRNLTMLTTQFNFRDLSSVGTGNVAEYTLSNLAPGGFVWDVTNRHQPEFIQGTTGTNYVFRAPADTIREFVASNGGTFLTPNFDKRIDHQDLHGLPQADYLIVTHTDFVSQANRLANLHAANGVSVHVVTTEQIFNEFSSGMVDATAIRMFAKMFYDRGELAPETRPKYLLLFGDGTFDPKNRVSSENYVITYQMLNSEDHINALVTDDYFGLLDDDESINSNDEMDIAVGRLLISSQEIADQQVDKIEHYIRNGSSLYSTANTNCSSDNGSSTFGDWRTKYVQIADDEEGGYFLNVDCEPAYNYIKDTFPEMNTDKLYLDAFQQITTAGGTRYPDVQKAINDRMERGALVMNYVGHGGEVGVAEERVITVPQIQEWKNIDKLTLLVSATCEFTKYDDPDRVSAGEWASLNPYGGAIALMTTTRSVFFGVNSSTISKFIGNVFDRNASEEPYTFGEIMMTTKNEASGGDNKRSFTLIGDPALKIAMPMMEVVTDSINGYDPATYVDTLQAYSKVTIKGHLRDRNGVDITDFNGVIYPTVFDKPKIQQTLGNDNSSPIINFELQNNKLYSGKASVTNGKFEFTFIVPKDINYSVDFGKISYYAENGVYDAMGEEQRVHIGGIDPNGLNDAEGPQIELYLNDNNFVNGGITDESPILIARLFDESGVNTVGNGIGHDLVAVLDKETGDPIVLNNYYTADLDSYQSGEVRYNFATLEPGPHTLELKVWDVNNNSSTATIDFVVQEQSEVVLDHVLNYPNPFTTSTEFYFEHNQACVDLDVQIQIFTVAGRLVKTINENVQCDGFRSKGIHWNGRDDFGDQLAKGVYVYHLKVSTPQGKKAEKTEKLVILR